jgi:hypothetical protein
MSTEPERPIEKLLRSYAKKRREQAGAPLELHPVNRRRLLQAEIAARKRKATPESGPTFSLLGRLLWGGAACAVMAIIVALFVPALRAPHEEMAKNELTLVTNSFNEALPAAVASEPNSESITGSSAAFAMLDSKVARETPKEEAKADSLSGVPATQPAVDSLSASSMAVAQNAPAAPAPVAAPAAATPLVRDDRQRDNEAVTLAQAPTQGFNRLRFEPATTNNLQMGAVSKLADVPSESLGTSSVMTFAAAPSSSRAGSDGVRNGFLIFDDAAKKVKDLGGTQYFARLGVSLQGAEKSQPSVMNAFALERSGTQVRIIDGDGSVYTGFVQTSALKMPAGSASNAELASVDGATRAPQRRLQADASFASALTNAFSYSFFVSGTNQTLNQLVSFSGSFQPSTNAVATQGFGGLASGGGAGLASQAKPVVPPQPPASIRGKLRVGASSENDFQAVARP